MWICMFSFFPRAIIEYNSYLPLTHWLVIALLLYHWSHCYILILRNTSQGVINVILKKTMPIQSINPSIEFSFFFILPLISHWVSIHLLVLLIIVLFPLTQWLFHKILVLFFYCLNDYPVTIQFIDFPIHCSTIGNLGRASGLPGHIKQDLMCLGDQIIVNLDIASGLPGHIKQDLMRLGDQIISYSYYEVIFYSRCIQKNS